MSHTYSKTNIRGRNLNPDYESEARFTAKLRSESGFSHSKSSLSNSFDHSKNSFDSPYYFCGRPRGASMKMYFFTRFGWGLVLVKKIILLRFLRD